jgi:putative endopeptidase
MALFNKINRQIFLCMSLAVTLSGFSEGNKNSLPGIDPANLDTTVSPARNFYQYANGGWLKLHPMPSEYSRYGAFDKLQEDNDKMVHELVDELAKKPNEPGSLARKIGDFYASGMDTARIDKEGIEPLKPEIENIQKVATVADVQKLIAHFHTYDITPLFGFYGEPDSKNSEMIIPSIAQDGLGLGDRDYYVATDKRSQEIRAEYVKHIAKMFVLAGYTGEQSEIWSKQVMAFETRLAKASKTRLELRDPEANYHKMKLADVQNLSPNIDWQGYFDNVGLKNPGEINVGQPEFFKEASQMLKDVPVAEWKAYLTWILIHSSAPYLSTAFVNENFEFFDKFMSGRKSLRPRWRRVLTTTSYVTGEALGQMYVDKYFLPSAKQRMLKLVENIRYALSERIKHLDWMGDSTKQKAFEKLAAIRVKVGYPDKWRDYSGLQVERGSYVLNVMKGRKFNYEFELNKINKPVDHDRWYMTPQTVNAYYNPSDNEICFPAGILQPPFFFADADDAVNYGAIGVVIGHEITHGFDDQGRKYDKKGNLNEWWTKEDSKRFNERSEVLAQLFSSFTVIDSTKADGHLTLGENIADLGGLNISYTALQKALKDNPTTEKIGGFTPEQRFYLAYGHVWGQHITDKEKLRRIKEDVHSLGDLRVNGQLPNLPEFHAAFGVKAGDAMYLPKEKRAVIW